MSNLDEVKTGGRARMLLLSTALVSAALAASPVMAQTTTAAAATTGAATESLQEVVVTARKRTENLQDTPVSVTALSAEVTTQLNLRNFQDLRGAVPNLEVLPLATGGASITIRGIGQTSSQVNVDAKAGFYVDEMYVARQEGNQLYFYDIDGVQVLKGPQGTLFGKNTTAGALLITTARPSAEGGSYVQLRGGNFNRIDTEGGINVPVSDKLLTRFSFRTQSADGYIKHVLDQDKSGDIDDKSARFQIRALPTDKLTVDLLAEYNKSNTNGNDSIARGCRPTAAYMNNYNATHSVRLCDAYPILNQKYLVYGGATLTIPTSAALTDRFKGGDYNPGGNTVQGHRGAFNDTEVSTLNARFNYDLTDDISLKSITGYRRSNSKWYNPTVDVPQDIYAEYDNTTTVQVTQELNLSGKAIGGKLNYVVGVYYYDQDTMFLQDTGPDWIDPTGYTNFGTNHFKSYAAYAQASYDFTEALQLTLGGRYNHDKKEGYSDVRFQTKFTAPCNGFVNAFQAGSVACNGDFFGQDTKTWKSFDPKGQLSYKFTPDLFGYVSVAKGYNAGGFNQQLGSNVAQGKFVSYDPERLWSYEAGFKSEWFERRLRLNVSAFYQKYNDIQTTVLVNINGVDTRQVQTGATAHEQGLEAEFELVPFKDFHLRANGAYLKQAYDSIRPGATITLTTPVNSAPKFSYSLSADYTVHPMGESSLTGSLNWRAIGKKAACNPIGSCYTPAYGLLGGRLDYRLDDASPWTFALWGTNLLDSYVQIAKNYGGSMGIDSVTPGRPREFGFEVRRTF
jgi:iron complex outermembrane receptor protein